MGAQTLSVQLRGDQQVAKWLQLNHLNRLLFEFADNNKTQLPVTSMRKTFMLPTGELIGEVYLQTVHGATTAVIAGAAKKLPLLAQELAPRPQQVSKNVPCIALFDAPDGTVVGYALYPTGSINDTPTFLPRDPTSEFYGLNPGSAASIISSYLGTTGTCALYKTMLGALVPGMDTQYFSGEEFEWVSFDWPGWAGGVDYWSAPVKVGGVHAYINPNYSGDPFSGSGHPTVAPTLVISGSSSADGAYGLGSGEGECFPRSTLFAPSKGITFTGGTIGGFDGSDDPHGVTQGFIAYYDPEQSSPSILSFTSGIDLTNDPFAGTESGIGPDYWVTLVVNDDPYYTSVNHGQEWLDVEWFERVPKYVSRAVLKFIV